MTVQPFGGVWSPSCASFALQKTVSDNTEFSFEARKTVNRNFYVDDCLKSVGTVTDAIELKLQLQQLLSRGGFKLVKWLSNNREVMASVQDDDRAGNAKGLDIRNDAIPNGRVLGIKWMTDADELGFDVDVKIKDLTRRGILSFISTIYDPLGLVSPAILMAKRIVQELTRKKVMWDEPITEPELSAWKLWVEELGMLTAFKIPRCLKPWNFGQVRDVQLHHFSDASQVAYGVVSYIRYVNTSGIVHTALLCSKSRLAPLKTMTIPRLELCAAALAVQVDKSLRQELDFEVGMSYFWTNSMIVLRYIRNNDKRFQTYVANRLSIIHNGSQPTQWCYVPTDLNPADDVSRGLSFNELIESIRWRVGPEFLRCDQTKWPMITNTTNNDEDGQLEVIKPKMYSSTLVSSESSAVDRLLSKFSSWYALKKAVAWLLRVKSLLKHIVIHKRGSGVGVLQFDKRITVNEFNEAEIAIIDYVQRQCFHLEITCLINNTAVPSNSPIYKLCPILTVGRTLCVGGRLKNANIPFMAQHQVILPGGHHVSALIVQWVHRINGHCGQEHILAILREKFWPTKARQVIRKELRSCVTCKRRRAEPGQQKMTDLPSDRVTPTGRPFECVGIDYFGPFEVKRGRSTIKLYGCLFTCLTVRAVHIEVARSLDTNSFIQALQRFIARRGKPTLIRSDNGTNFVGAKRELQVAVEHWNQTRIDEFLKQKQILWLFNPPAASHMGGVWERQIRTIRQILWSLSCEQTMDEESLSTLMCMTEAIINSRPITQVSDDPTEQALTPNYLLILHAGDVLPMDLFVKQDVFLRSWRQVQFLTDQFWKRWLKEYLPSLQPRSKWQTVRRNLAVGDIVLVLDERSTRGDWPLGRVMEIFSGIDGLVRSASVRTRGTLLTRPVTKLCLLEGVSDNMSEVQ